MSSIYSEIKAALSPAKGNAAYISAIGDKYATVNGKQYPTPSGARVNDAVLINGDTLVLQPRQAVDIFHV